MVARLVHRGGVVEAAVDHGVEHLLALADVRQRISVHDDQVGELSGLQRTDVGIEAQVLRAVPRSRFERLERRHPALHEHPELPVRAEALPLAMGPELHGDAGLVELIRDPRDREVIEVLFGRHHPPHRTGIELARRHELREPGLPDVGVLVQ